MKFKILLALLLFASAAQAQIETPVRWTYGAKRTSPSTAIIYLKVSIDPSWHIYSAYQKEGGPIKTSFEFTGDKSYVLNGQVVELKPVTRNEPAFNMTVSYFEQQVIFKQKIKLLSKTGDVNGQVTYMCCNDHKCLPPATVSFNVAVK